jgi:hypothetical protein
MLSVPRDPGANVDAHHHCDLCCPGSSVRYFGASHSLAPKQSHFNTTHYLSYRASGKRMRVRISAHPLAGSVGPLALGPLRFKDAQGSFSRKHAQLGVKRLIPYMEVAEHGHGPLFRHVRRDKDGRRSTYIARKIDDWMDGVIKDPNLARTKR